MHKLKCLFIDHAFHLKTKSTVFFKQILSNNFEVEDLWMSIFDEENFKTLLTKNVDFYVVFQYDFIVPFLLSNGKKVISVPMYDGTGEAHASHWLLQKEALIVNFSEALHKRSLYYGLNSIFSRYYPEKISTSILASNDNGYGIFFWERVPSTGLNVNWLAQKINKLIIKPKSLHIHFSADPGQSRSVHPLLAESMFQGVTVTTSTWFNDKAEYYNMVKSCDVYIAPRPYEGIGFSFIEALSLGKVVIGINNPTLNEYIINGVNGYLLDNLSVDFPELGGEKIMQISKEVNSDYLRGYEDWCLQKENLIRSIFGYLKMPTITEIKKITPSMAKKLSTAYFHDNLMYIALCTKFLPSINEKFEKLMMNKISSFLVLAIGDKILIRESFLRLRKFLT